MNIKYNIIGILITAFMIMPAMQVIAETTPEEDLPLPEPPYQIGDVINYNGSFEHTNLGDTEADAWTINALEGSTYQIVDDSQDGDGRAVQFQVSHSGALWYDNEVVNEYISMVGGETYEISVWIKADSDNRYARVYLGMQEDDAWVRARGWETPITTLDENWKQVTFIHTASTVNHINSMRVGIEFNNEANDGGTIYVDNVQVTRISPVADGNGDNEENGNGGNGDNGEDLFFLADNNVTVMCPDAQVGDTGVVNGITYTKRTRNQITNDNAPTTCTSGITDMSGLFAGADDNPNDFNGDISHWDVSNVENMASKFLWATSFNKDISNWDVNSVTDMSFMFGAAVDFDQNLNSWDVSNVTDMRGIFGGAESFNQNIGSWSVNSATNMSWMFHNATSFNQDIGNWDVSSVTSMHYMFTGAISFNQNIGGWNVENVTDMRAMFNNAESFDQDIGAWDVSNVTDMNRMFRYANAFNQDLGNWNVENVAEMDQMLENTNLSPENYDNLLLGWATQNLNSEVELGAEGLTYCEGGSARQTLINDFQWNINDAGISGSCVVDLTPPEIEPANIVAWGDNQYDQSEVPDGLDDIIDIAAGEYHSIALRENGDVVAWGRNNFNQTEVPSFDHDVIAVAAGYRHNMVLLANGTVQAWGNNGAGQTDVPADLSNVTAIASGGFHNLALREDGTVIAWGQNQFEQTDVPSGLSDVIAIDAGEYHSIALHADGTVSAWGRNIYNQTDVPGDLEGVVAIAAGDRYHNLAVLDDGTVRGWGSNFNSVLSIPNDLDPAVGVYAGLSASFALLADGSVQSWGSGTNSFIPGELNEVLTLTARSNHSIALTKMNLPDAPGKVALQSPANGATDVAMEEALVWNTTGEPSFYELQVAEEQDFEELHASSMLTSSGNTDERSFTNPVFQFNTTYYWRVRAATLGGFGEWSDAYEFTKQDYAYHLPVVGWGQPGHAIFIPEDAINIKDATIGFGTSVLLHTDGSLTSLGYSYNMPEDIEDVIAIDMGISNVIALLEDGTVSNWGNNIEVPQNLENVTAISAGYEHYLALTDNGEVFAWGNSFYDETAIVVPDNLEDVLAISAGFDHNLVLHSDGTITAWGHDYGGDLVLPENLQNVTAISAGAEFAMALHEDGTVTAWGNNEFGQTDVPESLENVVEISAGYRHALALTETGEIVAWGLNNDGQTDIPPGLAGVQGIRAGLFQNLAIGGSGRVLTLLQPADKATGVDLQPFFEWERGTSGEGNINYFQLSTDPTFTDEDAFIQDNEVTQAAFDPTEHEVILQPMTIYFWRVGMQSSGGSRIWSDAYSFTTVSVASANNELPDEFAIAQNYPNPFNPTTVINYQLPVNSDVRLEVFDILGRRVALLVNGQVEAGYHNAEFNANNLASGMYIYRITAGDFVETRQMMLVK